MFVSVSPERSSVEIFFLFFLPIILSLASTRRLLIPLGSIFFNSLRFIVFIYFYTNSLLGLLMILPYLKQDVKILHNARS